MDTEFFVYLKLKPYVRQWLTAIYGEPVRFNAHSLENNELMRWLIPVPDGCMPLTKEPGTTAIVIPDSKKKKPLEYNYLTKEARDCIVSMLNNNFDSDMKHSVRHSMHNGSSKVMALRAWMKEHKIDKDYECTLVKRIDRTIAFYKSKKLNFFSFDARSEKDKLKKLKNA